MGAPQPKLTMRQSAVLAVMQDRAVVLSTPSVLRCVNERAPRTLVLEQVYRALLTLQHRGLVRRVDVGDSTKAYWQNVIDEKEVRNSW